MRNLVFMAVVLGLLAGLPFALWIDLRELVQSSALVSLQAVDINTFRATLLYFVALALSGCFFLLVLAHQTRALKTSGGKLDALNAYLERLAKRLSVHLSPQLHKSIFSGDGGLDTKTRRKKLCVFFSRINEFAATTDPMQPEDMSALLNEYLTEMTDIALRHGGTVDKYVGDAILIFFGDPETLGEEQDAKACLRMAVEMQNRLAELNIKWRRRGVSKPFAVRIGINAGFCNVGNFGSASRLDYTIVGAEADLAARLAEQVKGAGIAISHEAHELAKDIVQAAPGKPIAVKGIARSVKPFFVEGLNEHVSGNARVLARSDRGVDLYVDADEVDQSALDDIIAGLQKLKGQPQPGE